MYVSNWLEKPNMVPRPNLGGDFTFLCHGPLGRGVPTFAPTLVQNQWLGVTPKIKIRKRDSHSHTPHRRNTCTQRVTLLRTQCEIGRAHV